MSTQKIESRQLLLKGNRTLLTLCLVTLFSFITLAQGGENAMGSFFNILQAFFVVIGLIVIGIHFSIKSNRAFTAFLLLGYGLLILWFHLTNNGAGHDRAGYSFWNDFNHFIPVTIVAAIALTISLNYFIRKNKLLILNTPTKNYHHMATQKIENEQNLIGFLKESSYNLYT